MMPSAPARSITPWERRRALTRCVGEHRSDARRRYGGDELPGIQRARPFYVVFAKVFGTGVNIGFSWVRIGCRKHVVVLVPLSGPERGASRLLRIAAIFLPDSTGSHRGRLTFILSTARSRD
jgi:hypothetical protein